MRTVVPCYIKIEGGMVTPSYETVELGPIIILMLSQISYTRSTLYILPEFTPTPDMLEMHADKGKEPWEVFAWCIRDIISKNGNIPKQDNNKFEDKWAYIDFMNGHKDYMEVQGRIFRIGGTYNAENFEKLS